MGFLGGTNCLWEKLAGCEAREEAVVGKHDGEDKNVCGTKRLGAVRRAWPAETRGGRRAPPKYKSGVDVSLAVALRREERSEDSDTMRALEDRCHDGGEARIGVNLAVAVRREERVGVGAGSRSGRRQGQDQVSPSLSLGAGGAGGSRGLDLDDSGTIEQAVRRRQRASAAVERRWRVSSGSGRGRSGSGGGLLSTRRLVPTLLLLAHAEAASDQVWRRDYPKLSSSPNVGEPCRAPPVTRVISPRAVLTSHPPPLRRPFSDVCRRCRRVLLPPPPQATVVARHPPLSRLAYRSLHPLLCLAQKERRGERGRVMMWITLTCGFHADSAVT
uniref:Uncharacterized protein n=1 Tax=Oryza barthii TaxID=65489 RepID=A0A0D3FZ59_9ORYZ